MATTRQTGEAKAPRVREAPDMEAFVLRVIRSMVGRAVDGDMDSLVALEHVRLTVEPAMRAAVSGLRSKAWGYSWADIGNALGVSKQAAQQRFSG